jgi:hypothetical protein
MTATTTHDSTDVILAKVQKIWRKANDVGATDEERAIFEAKALQMLADNRLSLADLDLGYEDTLGDEFVVKLDGRNARLSIDLLDLIARAFDCRVYWSGYGLTYNVSVFGFKSDRERVKGLYTMLEADCAAQAVCVKGYDMADTKAQRRGFRQGYASAIARRLREAKRAAQAEAERNGALEALFGPDALDEDIDWSDYEDEIQAALVNTKAHSNALVLVERGKQVENAYAQKKLRSAASTRSGGSSGRSAGRAAGERANLNRSARVGSGSRRALSA